MIRVFILASMALALTSAHAEMSTAPEQKQPTANSVSVPLVRNIGIAEPGDAIVVRERDKAAVPQPKPTEEK